MSHTKPHGPTRTETDTMGPIQVPADRYWGAQTERSHHHFPFGDRMPLAIVHAFGLLKAACAQANADMGGLAANLRRRHCHHRSQPFSTSDDEVRCEFGQICISGAYRGKQSSLYAFAIAIH